MADLTKKPSPKKYHHRLVNDYEDDIDMEDSTSQVQGSVAEHDNNDLITFQELSKVSKQLKKLRTKIPAKNRLLRQPVKDADCDDVEDYQGGSQPIDSKDIRVIDEASADEIANE